MYILLFVLLGLGVLWLLHFLVKKIFKGSGCPCMKSKKPDSDDTYVDFVEYDEIDEVESSDLDDSYSDK